MDRYLAPLAETPEMAAVLEAGARVTAISRLGADKVVSKDREAKPFVLSMMGADGSTRRDLARAVIDASGTWTNRPSGRAVSQPMARQHFPTILPMAFRTCLAVTETLMLARPSWWSALVTRPPTCCSIWRAWRNIPRTSITWVTRSANLMRVYGGGSSDQLPKRGELGANLKDLVDSGRVTLCRFAATACARGRPSPGRRD